MKILEALRDQKKVSVGEFSRQFDVAESNMQLDLADLEDSGLVHCFRGGAKIVEVSTFDARMERNSAQKAGIARLAASHVQEGEALYLDSGTTVMLLARELKKIAGVTVITNSPPLLPILSAGSDRKIILVGGEYSHDDRCCFGLMTEKELADIYVSKVFMGADHVDVENGGVFAHLRNLGYIRKIVTNARQTILLSDSSKFNRIQGMKILDLSSVDIVITDAGLPASLRARITEKGITLEIAGETETKQAPR
jgi:DeoR family transcriptional regulator, fructose operon transcriptional repressor